ncbi:porphobilinogen synthase [Aquincola sp. S2]|uniref:Delta-aminolevulinic acid dehydratase n=1 Tax=Pseudaquabacterium terrae TaxID=2732868 RepID=A0ABX2EGR6_9BURK|nr:porphobilinogen synthase [Aquabacterium terrae]NRF67812.1 porphobilinogen synthase [Aquabacterium terrae]
MRPFRRLHRMRSSGPLRALCNEASVRPGDLIYPIFVDEGLSRPVEVATMPGVLRHTEQSLLQELEAARASGIASVILFGVSQRKDDCGSDAMRRDGLLARMIGSAKTRFPDLNIIADICICEYTTHGHCGSLTRDRIDNDATIANLGRQAVVAAAAGADVLAPSGMMDGMVSAIRSALDEAGFHEKPILSYSSKFSSSFYGPFREASGITLGKGNREAYQADPSAPRQALLESLIDEAEGADALMVKPGMAYLDILYRLKERTLLPVGAYQVSGEYAMIKFAAQHGALDERAAVLESLLAFKRAGADFILTYFAKDAARYLG